MNRRQLLQRAGLAAAALGASRFPFGWAAPADAPKKKILVYTRSQGFQHDVVKRRDELVAMVDGKPKTYAVFPSAAVTLDGKKAKIGDVPKDAMIALTVKSWGVTRIDATSSPTAAPPAPADAKVETGTMVSVTPAKLLSQAEQTVTDLGAKHNIDVVCEKDGRVFLSNDFPSFDGFVFETQGNLLSENSQDGTPPMTLDGKKALLDAVAGGKGFVGCHCASDTFHTPNTQAYETAPRDKVDPYIAMVGGEFIIHGAQQQAPVQVVDPKWPGLENVKDSATVNEEWYSLKNFAPDLHVILVMDTSKMNGFMYERASFPQTWARKHDKGRVFFTSFGHREDVWASDLFQNLLMGGLSWALGNVDADVAANIDKATPKANELPMKK